MSTWQCVLYIKAVIWSPQGKSSPDHPGLCSSAVSSDTLRGASHCHITVFSSQSLLQEVKKKRTKKKITKLIFLASPPQQSNREVTGCPGEEAAAVGACASTSWLPSPDLKLGLSPLDCRGREGRKKKKGSSTFSEQEEGEATSVSCCAAETSKDVITLTFPQGVSRLRAKVQSFPMHCKEGGFGGETSSGFIANSVLCTCIAKQLSSVLPSSAAKYRMWLETIFAQELCCSCFSCTACVRILLQYTSRIKYYYNIKMH